MVKLAKSSHVPVVSVTETKPPHEDYQTWIRGELAAIAQALPE
jgi:zinc/manganese transport system substrate-binding protein